jgi:PhnB protein
MIQARPTLLFAGDCETAFKLYERCLGGKIAFMLRWGDSPMAADVPADWRGKILYTRMEVGDSTLVAGDLPPNQYERPQGFSIQLLIDDAAEAERVFNTLAENGTIKMPLQETFWATHYGNLVDRFGIPWEINCERT